VFRRILALGLVVCATGAVYASLAGAMGSKSDRFNASLEARQEVPKPDGVPALASGHFDATLTGSKLEWKLTFKHLTGKATAAHIHIAAKGKAGPVAVPLCGPCTSGLSKTVVIKSSVIDAMKKGNAYVNIHTAKNAAGEIRGQIHG